MRNTKRVLALALTVLMLVGIVPVGAISAVAEGDEELGGVALDSSKSLIEGLEGSGAENDPVLINSCDDWKTFAAAVNSVFDATIYDGNFFSLTADLDFSSFDANGETEGNGHEKLIVAATQSYGFSGTFDGNGHTVSGLSITTEGNRVGLFGCLIGATVKNINISNCIFESSASKPYMGAVTGHAFGNDTQPDVNIVNCIITDTVDVISNNGGRIGGVVGNSACDKTYTSVTTNIISCEVYANVTLDKRSNEQFVGGVVGIASNSANAAYTSILNISDCVVGSTVRDLNSSEATNAGVDGGVVGYSCTGIANDKTSLNLVISNCDVDVDIYVENGQSRDVVGAYVGKHGNKNAMMLFSVTNTNMRATGVDKAFGADNQAGYTSSTIDDTCTGIGAATTTVPASSEALHTYRESVYDYADENDGTKLGIDKTAESGLEYAATTLILDDAQTVTLRQYFALADGATAPTTLKVGEYDIALNQKGKLYYIDIKVALTALETEFTVMNADAEITGIKYKSVSAYASALKTASDTDGAENSATDKASTAVQNLLAYASAVNA